jgi:hypothetical protein
MDREMIGFGIAANKTINGLRSVSINLFIVHFYYLFICGDRAGSRWV